MSSVIELTPPVVFLSDLHLNASHRDQYLFNFLDFLSHKYAIGSLVLVGDVFDFHLGYKHTLYRHLFPFYQRLYQWKSQNKQIHLFTGNHDPDPDPFLIEDLAIQVHTAPQLFRIKKDIIRVEHGDQQDPQFIKRTICKWVRHPFTRSVARLLPPSYYQTMCKTLLHSSTSPSASPSNDITRSDVDIPFPTGFIAQCWHRMHQHNPSINAWIMGHYHRVACLVDSQSTGNTSELGLPKVPQKIIFLGDWVHLHTFLYWTNEDIFLYHYKQGKLHSLSVGDHTSDIL